MQDPRPQPWPPHRNMPLPKTCTVLCEKHQNSRWEMTHLPRGPGHSLGTDLNSQSQKPPQLGGGEGGVVSSSPVKPYTPEDMLCLSHTHTEYGTWLSPHLDSASGGCKCEAQHSLPSCRSPVSVVVLRSQPTDMRSQSVTCPGPAPDDMQEWNLNPEQCGIRVLVFSVRVGPGENVASLHPRATGPAAWSPPS